MESRTENEQEPSPDTGVEAQGTVSERKLDVEEKGQTDVDANVQEALSAVSTPCRAAGRPEAHPDGAANSPAVVGQQGWEKYLVAGGKDFWWYCNNGGEWFLEASPGPWAKYFDPASKKYYWQRDEETFFWAS